ncbi:MFS transporter [Dactylosporangium sp. NBC_01737]|uniref:MFS transporter n=1 Tax=Dactylosporangium sp. NBC_01737 TaxID=2975959 RepID=UPI002E152250|nr:MFS transporter [Dactylosporangium sp. NBC_01737]
MDRDQRDLYPSTIRGLGVSAATAANWAAAWLVTQFFLSLTSWIGESGTFGVFAGMCVVSFVFVWKLLPETKGKTLGEIQQMWVDRTRHVATEP